MSVLSNEQLVGMWPWSISKQEVEVMQTIINVAIAADRAARAEAVAWATPAGIAAIHAARLGRADNVQIPLSTYPGGDHSVGFYTAPPAASPAPNNKET